MSFAETTAQILDRSKTVTRRTGWLHLKPGDRVWAVEKGMGLRKGEKVRRLALLEIVSVTREPIEAITDADVVREGFPDWTREQYIDLYRRINSRSGGDDCTRIEFRYLGESGRVTGNSLARIVVLSALAWVACFGLLQGLIAARRHVQAKGMPPGIWYLLVGVVCVALAVIVAERVKDRGQ